MYQLEEHDREIQEAKRQAAKLPQIAARLFIAEQRTKQLEELCRDLYRITAHEGYIDNGLHNRLVELGFAEGE